MAAWRAMTAVAMLALGAAAACDSDDPLSPTEAIVQSIRTDAHVMAATHESNVGEIAAGEVALAKGADARVRDFAQMMIDDHTALDAEGQALAAQLGITPALPDQRLPQLQAQELQALNAAPAGATFGRTYMAQQIAAHERTLALIDETLPRARAEVRTLLEGARPAVAAHLTMAREIEENLGGS